MAQFTKILLGATLAFSFAASAMADPAETTLAERNVYLYPNGVKVGMPYNASHAMAAATRAQAIAAGMPHREINDKPYGDPGRW